MPPSGLENPFKNLFKPKTPEQAEKAVKKVMQAEFEKGTNMISMRLAYNAANRMNQTLREDIRLNRNRILNMLRVEANMGTLQAPQFGDESLGPSIEQEIENIRREEEDKPQK